LAIYTTDQSPSWIRKVTYCAYPAFLIAALAESVVFGCWLWRTPTVPGRIMFLTAELLTWLPAAVLVIGMVVQRIKQLPERNSAA
jgi:hypothetical protein